VKFNVNNTGFPNIMMITDLVVKYCKHPITYAGNDPVCKVYKEDEHWYMDVHVSLVKKQDRANGIIKPSRAKARIGLIIGRELTPQEVANYDGGVLSFIKLGPTVWKLSPFISSNIIPPAYVTAVECPDPAPWEQELITH